MSALNKDMLSELFSAAFGQSPELVVQAPGRVNLIGEHTDYNGGFVLPAAISYATWIAASARADNELHVIAQDFDAQSVVIKLDQPMQHDQAATWSNYVRGVVQELQKKGYTLKGGNLLISGNVPAGAGLSSSASLEVAVVRALTELSGESIDPTQAALVGQAAENNFVGCNCGIMDQLISARGEESSALLIDCQDLSTRSVSIPRDWEILIVHSGVKRGLVESEYNQRRAQCETAAAFFGQKSLRGVSIEQLVAAEGKLDDLSFRRARHVLTENARTLLAAEALSSGDMETLARVMAESHESMRDDFNITTPAIDRLVEILQTAGAGSAGARMTGGGFGGCVVSIAPKSLIPKLMKAVDDFYEAETGCTPRLIPAKASKGAFAG
ncbi:galactokinase [Cellvibrio sp.]|uniref:galactokinase n=1 Tax=Cellvibrio sp. TaxID=1965322 RepID=UPI00396486D7